MLPENALPPDMPRFINSLDLLLPYQIKWAYDPSRWKFGLMARQVGKDHASAEEGIRDCLHFESDKKKTTWLIAAPSERQSLESLDKWKEWAAVYKLGIDEFQEVRSSGAEALLKSATITFPRGSRVIAVPGRPDTVRGYSANILLTEFAFFEDPDATWRAILPSITNPLRGGVKKVRLITTPNGIGNRAYDLWLKNYHPDITTPNPNLNLNLNPTPSQWSCHLVDIHTAVQQGLQINIDELRNAIDDPEGWAQEFECQFLDVQAVLLPYDLIASCESPDAPAAPSPDFWQTRPPFPVVLGIDFGRRRDLTVSWALGKQGDVHHTLEVLALEKMPTPQQVEILSPRIAASARVCFDYTGPGIGLGDYLVKQFGEWNPARHKAGKIELCSFTNVLKVEIFSKLRIAFEKRTLRVPVNRAIREDLHSLNRVASSSGQITYRAPHTADGHADRGTALALALRAASDAPVSPAFSKIEIRRPADPSIPL